MKQQNWPAFFWTQLQVITVHCTAQYSARLVMRIDCFRTLPMMLDCFRKLEMLLDGFRRLEMLLDFYTEVWKL